ncbi:hypothetical protein ILP97_49075 [Amycolatopsis sp. H6(2020)]|nr:hypothetical protein [Amycolatopsis sp. H6(2020)]
MFALGLLVMCAMATPAGASPGSGAESQVTAGTTVTVPYISRTRIDGEWVPIDYSRDFTVTAPASAKQGQAFDVRFDSAPILAIGLHNKTLKDLRIAYRVTGPVTVVKYRLDGGSNTGDAQFRVERHGSDLLLRSDGPFPGGVEFDVPDLVVTVVAKGKCSVVTSPGGSSFDDPAFYWFREQTQTGSWDPFENYVDPAKPITFTTTTVG